MMTFYKAMRLLLVVLLVVVFAGVSDYMYGQAGRGRGRLRGLVLDPDGKAVVNAKVQIVWHKDKAQKRKSTTNDKGRFAISGLAGGNWQIFIDADGFRQAQVMASIQQVPDNPIVNIKLEKPREKVVQDSLSTDNSLISQGKKLFAEARYDEAQAKFEKFLLKQPDFYQTHLEIGNCHKEKEEFELAMAQYKKALEKAPTDGTDIQLIAQVNAAIGDLYIRKKDLKTAQEFFKKSLELDPKDEILAYNVGEIFFSNNKTNEAIHYFKLASLIKPKWGTPHLKMGYAYLNSADYKNAVTCFKKFLELDPESAEAPAIKELIASLKDM
jgi:tetratricopeptide (TPR) repeat protein